MVYTRSSTLLQGRKARNRAVERFSRISIISKTTDLLRKKGRLRNRDLPPVPQPEADHRYENEDVINAIRDSGPMASSDTEATNHSQHIGVNSHYVTRDLVTPTGELALPDIGQAQQTTAAHIGGKDTNISISAAKSVGTILGDTARHEYVNENVIDAIRRSKVSNTGDYENVDADGKMLQTQDIDHHSYVNKDVIETFRRKVKD